MIKKIWNSISYRMATVAIVILLCALGAVMVIKYKKESFATSIQAFVVQNLESDSISYITWYDKKVDWKLTGKELIGIGKEGLRESITITGIKKDGNGTIYTGYRTTDSAAVVAVIKEGDNAVNLYTEDKRNRYIINYGDE